MGRRGKSLLCGPGSEFRLGRREREIKAKTTNGKGKPIPVDIISQSYLSIGYWTLRQIYRNLTIVRVSFHRRGCTNGSTFAGRLSSSREELPIGMIISLV